MIGPQTKPISHESTQTSEAEAVLAALSAAIDAEVAAHAARTAAAPREVRALTVHATTPAGHEAFPVVDDRNAPHLRAGEVAVVDTADRTLQHGELFAVRYRSGPAIMQAIRRGSAGWAAWWCVQLDRPIGAAEVASWAIEGHAIPESDGPYGPGQLESLVLGRVVGIMLSVRGVLTHG